jgi:hypothetical protein
LFGLRTVYKMSEITHQWSQGVTCRFCKHTFNIQATDVLYEDLKQEFIFVPDWQYFVKCEECNENLILHDIPPHVAVWIQTGLLTPK